MPELAHVRRLLNLLENAKPAGAQWKARCPAHEDKSPSLSICIGSGGMVLLKCFAGCTVESVVSKLNLTLRDLRPDDGADTRPPARSRTRRATPAFATLDEAAQRATPRRYKLVATWTYHDADGRDAFWVCRYNAVVPPKDSAKPNKTFRPIHRTAEGFVVRDPPGMLPLYRLPDLRAAPAATVFLPEGERKADLLASLGLVATTTAHGAESPKKTDLSALAGRDVVLLPDNDDAGMKYAQVIVALLHALTPHAKVRIVHLPDLPAKGDAVEFIIDRRAKGKSDVEIRREIDEHAANASVVPCPPHASRARPRVASRDGGLPRIIVTDRPLRDIVDDAVRAIDAQNHPPVIFQQSGSVVRVCIDDHETPIIQRMDEARMIEALTRASDLFKVLKKEFVHVSPSKVVAQTILALKTFPFPSLEAITEIPVLRSSGTILSTPGYDPETRLLYSPASGLTVPVVPESPDADQIAAASALLREVICDFPFADNASRTNAVALMLTPTLRPAIDGHVPLAIADAPRMGTGKSLLVSANALISTGRAAAMMSVPENEAEWRKQLTSVLATGDTYVTIDNVEGVLRSPSLSRFLTCSTWVDRLLGGNDRPKLPQRTTCCANGNNVQVLGDLRRRCYRIRLDAQLAKPWTRSGFRHPELLAWVTINRGAILAAILTLARAWFAAGRPSSNGARFGGFDGWAKTVGGVLIRAGFEDFLGNQDEFFEQISSEDTEWEVFLATWRDVFGSTPITVAQLVERIQIDDKLKGALPGPLAEYIPAAPGRNLAMRLGKALVARCDTRYGEQGFHLRRASRDAHAKTNCWRVVTNQEAHHEQV